MNEQQAPAQPGPAFEDVGATFVLRGRAVTMNDRDEVVESARVLVQRGTIVDVLPARKRLPPDFRAAPVVETKDTIYPGLLDLHNHFVYNVLCLWPVPKTYDNRSQWPRHNQYAATVALPARALAAYADSARAMVRYVEAKALMGGTTTGQGINTRVNGGRRLFRGGLRTVEDTGDRRLPEASTRVPTLQVKDIAAFRDALERYPAYFYHLAEGTDEAAHETFTDLKSNGLVRKSLVAIHALGLRPDDLKFLADQEAKLVWSPFSNLLLYGRTLDLAAVKRAGVLFSIGCDWSPTGSKNLLQELKVARHVVRQQQADFTSRDLVRAVTADAARVVGWHPHLGTLQRGSLADLLVIAGGDGDPYDRLIDATEADVRLVVVHGEARYGDRGLVGRLHQDPKHPPEECEVGGVPKALTPRNPDASLKGVSFASARNFLTDAMQDLPAFREQMAARAARLQALGAPPVEPFLVELDNEYTPPEDELASGAVLLADWNKLARSVPLDPVEVDGEEYWGRLASQKNLAKQLGEDLRRAYAR